MNTSSEYKVNRKEQIYIFSSIALKNSSAIPKKGSIFSSTCCLLLCTNACTPWLQGWLRLYVHRQLAPEIGRHFVSEALYQICSCWVNSSSENNVKCTSHDIVPSGLHVLCVDVASWTPSTSSVRQLFSVFVSHICITTFAHVDTRTLPTRRHAFPES